MPMRVLTGRTERRAASLLLLAVAPPALALLVGARIRLLDVESHSALEFICVTIALFAGVLGLARYYSRRDDIYLLIGSGFLGTFLFDVYHAIATSELDVERGSALDVIGPYSWLASRLFLAGVVLATALIAPRQPVSRDRLNRREIYLLFTLAALLNVVFFATFPLPRSYFPELLAPRPYDLLPALLFAAGAALYWRHGSWKDDIFAYGLLASMVLGAASELVMAFSNELYDVPFTIGHLARTLGYLAVIAGLLGSVYATFRSVDESRRLAEVANDTLAREVDDRRRAEERARESQERLQRFLDEAQDLILSAAPDGRLVYANETWKRTLGYPGEDFRRVNLLEVVHPDQRHDFAVQMGRVLAGGSSGRIETTFLTRSGQRIHVSGTASARFETGRAVEARAIFRDVTDKVRAEAELLQQKAYFEELFENAPEGIVVLDAFDRVERANDEFLRMFGYEEHEVLGMQLHRLIVPERVWGEAMDLTRAVARGEPVAMEAVRRRSDGTSIEVSVLGTPVVLGERQVAVYAIYRDITEQKATERQLVEAKEQAEAASVSKSRFLATMSHELRTPLNSIIGFTRVLLTRAQARLGDRERLFLERIHENGNHLLELINDILDLSKVEAGRLELTPSRFDLRELIEETLSQLTPQARNDVRLRAELPEGEIPILSDPVRLRQILVNLVGNALKFTAEGEVVVAVETGRGNRPRSITVRDTGVGIPADKLESIFDAFQQADSTTSREYGGTGLGLTISRSLCRLLGCDLQVRSEVGVGSEFTIALDERSASRAGTGAASPAG